jgi:hypothetical protein
MEELLLEGDVFEYRRELKAGQPSWDLASVAGPNGALLFALDLAYVPDAEEKVFKFTPAPGAITIRDRVSVTGIYVLAPVPGLRGRLEARHAERCRFERSVGFDPAHQAADLEILQRLLRTEGRTP